MPPHPAAALLSKRWDLLAKYKDQRVRDRKKLGIREALRVVGLLRMQARFFQPSWPTQEDREQDLETHIRVAKALSHIAAIKANRKAPSSSRKAPSTSATRRDRRVRRPRGA